MEPSLLERGTIEFEARRVAAAFGVEEWEKEFNSIDQNLHIGKIDGLTFRAKFDVLGEWFSLGFENLGCCLFDNDEWGCAGRREMLMLWPGLEKEGTNERVARGLYRLGFEDEAVLSQLPPLSAHEQMELRLSMPREFWPRKWLAEEKQEIYKDD